MRESKFKKVLKVKFKFKKHQFLVMEEELPTLLLRLSRDIIDIARNIKENQKIEKMKILLIRTKIINFEYKEGITSYIPSTEYIEKEEEWIEGVDEMYSEIKKLPLYIEACKRISDTYGVEESQAESWLGRFTSRIINNALNEKISEETLFENINIFLNDLEQNPVTWEVLVEIDGLWLKDDEEIELAKGIKLRRLRPSDLEFECPIELMLSPFPETAFRPISAIMEIKQRAETQSSVSEELEKIITALRLYKLGSVQKGVTKFTPKSILQRELAQFSVIQPTVYRYSLGSNELDKIKNFLNKIKPLIPVTKGRIETTDYLSISLQRYNDALFKPNPIERIAYAIMGLESLFLKRSEREELSHRLAQRVAKCLSIFNYQPVEVYKEIKQSYKIRSGFVHGSMDKDELRYSGKLVDKVMEYLRLSILMFMELKEKVEKESFLNTIDNSLLHHEAQAKLQSLIKEYCNATQSII